ncbi:MAG TPA: Gfo/Idh/MocA family oxidoreductase [Chryseosolibacter sp.]
MKILMIATLLLIQPYIYAQTAVVEKPLRVGIAGLSHGHVHGILKAAAAGRLLIAGVAEPNRELAERLLRQYNIPIGVLYADLGEMLDKTKPEAVAAFGSIFDHLHVVKECAPRRIHVMVEKPLAVSLDHARQMEALAKKYGIKLLTNYETTWYGSNHVAYRMLHDEKQFGDIVKMVVHDGHQGPKEIGVNQEFLEWLTDPVLNGGGALMDFGCYGADLVTWLMKGERPISVFAITQQIKPQVYPKVDDEATLVVMYPKAQAIIQASWNWPYSRKDMEVYGQFGYVMADRDGVRYMTNPEKGEEEKKIPLREKPYDDPFDFFTAVVRGTVVLGDDDLSSLAVNMVAMEILDAAKRSSREGRVIALRKK